MMRHLKARSPFMWLVWIVVVFLAAIIILAIVPTSSIALPLVLGAVAIALILFVGRDLKLT